MKSLLLTVLLMTSFNSFASTSSMGEQDELRCKESIQSARGQEELEEAKVQIKEAQEATSASV